jgi:murein DD-endopeptidase MepM/ murein hydrolase activator NlpD
MFIRRFLAIGLVFVMMFLAVGSALANELQEQQGKAAEAQRKVESVSERLHRVQKELDDAQGEYSAIQKKLDATEDQIEINKEILSKTEKSLSERSQVLNKRIRDIYQNGQLSYIDVLFGANDFGDFTTRMDILKRIMNQDIGLIVKVKAERELILQKKAELETDRQTILNLKQTAVDKKKEIQSRKNEEEKLLAAATSDRDAAEQAYQELLESSRRIGEMLRRSSGGAVGGTGSMMWPTNATEITSPYGWRTHPIWHTQRYHSGVDIGASYGDSVRAADGGVVKHAGWYGGYGKAVIIDHGNGISTLYGHNSQLLVGEGQTVRKGEVISRVGSTGDSTGPHLHFEVRLNGEPTDPMHYVQ